MATLGFNHLTKPIKMVCTRIITNEDWVRLRVRVHSCEEHFYICLEFVGCPWFSQNVQMEDTIERDCREDIVSTSWWYSIRIRRKWKNRWHQPLTTYKVIMSSGSLTNTLMSGGNSYTRKQPRILHFLLNYHLRGHCRASASICEEVRALPPLFRAYNTFATLLKWLKRFRSLINSICVLIQAILDYIRLLETSAHQTKFSFSVNPASALTVFLRWTRHFHELHPSLDKTTWRSASQSCHYRIE